MINIFKLWPSKVEKEARSEARKENARSIEAVREKRLELHRAIEELRAARAATFQSENKGQT